MIKKEIYPKTKRLSCNGDKVYITEKLDGSNLCIFKKDEKVYIAQRSNIFCLEEIGEAKPIMYKGLYQWLNDNKDVFYDLHNNSVKCFIYPFQSQEIPKCIGIVPEVTYLVNLPNKEHLDSIYSKYCEKKNRSVEGFVVNYKDKITKYVRMKNGQLKEHFDRCNNA